MMEERYRQVLDDVKRAHWGKRIYVERKHRGSDEKREGGIHTLGYIYRARESRKREGLKETAYLFVPQEM